MNSLVMAGIMDGAHNAHDLVILIIGVVVLAALARHVVTDNHRMAWLAVPIVLVILVLEKPSGSSLLSNLATEIVRFFGGL
jgi:hypothetical protein